MPAIYLELYIDSLLSPLHFHLTFYRPRVTFHQSDSMSKSEIIDSNLGDVDREGNTDDREEAYMDATEISDKGLGRNVSSENRLSAGWSTMDSQYRSLFLVLIYGRYFMTIML